MSISNRKPGEKKEAPAEPLKRSIAGAMKAIARKPDLEVTFASDRPALMGDKARLPEPPRRLTSQDVAILRGNADAIRAMGATSLYLFGSVARDKGGADSDLDLFIDYDPARRFSLLDLVGIKQLLEERMSADIDITTRDSLHPMLKDDIERSAVRVF